MPEAYARRLAVQPPLPNHSAAWSIADGDCQGYFSRHFYVTRLNVRMGACRRRIRSAPRPATRGCAFPGAQAMQSRQARGLDYEAHQFSTGIVSFSPGDRFLGSRSRGRTFPRATSRPRYNIARLATDCRGKGFVDLFPCHDLQDNKLSILRISCGLLLSAGGRIDLCLAWRMT